MSIIRVTLSTNHFLEDKKAALDKRAAALANGGPKGGQTKRQSPR